MIYSPFMGMPEGISTTKDRPVAPSFGEALRFWIKLGLISFGGPAGQIAIMHKELVEKKCWISESQFFHALNFCMILPGPEAQQLATYLGWRLHGTRGGIVAGTWFVLPSALLLFGLSWLFMLGSQWTWLQSIFSGLQAAVVALIADALLRMGRKALRSTFLWIVAISSLIIMLFASVSFVVMIAVAALLGYLTSLRWPQQFPIANQHGKADDKETYLSAMPAIAQPWRRALRVILTCTTLWMLPLIIVASLWGWQSTSAQMGLFFSKAAMVTFGGAYAVLPYVAQQAVEQHLWLSHAQMMSGLALAETTPGPLIMVLQFVGFVGGWQNPGSLSPLAAASVCALITTWCTFVPCFLSIFLAAPYLDRFGQSTLLRAIMSTITATIVGVIGHLCIVLAKHTWVNIDTAGNYSPNIALILLSIAALALLKFTRCGVVTVIGLCAVVGWLLSLT